MYRKALRARVKIKKNRPLRRSLLPTGVNVDHAPAIEPLRGKMTRKKKYYRCLMIPHVIIEVEINDVGR